MCGVCIRTTHGCGREKTREPSETHHRQTSSSASYLKNDKATTFVDECGDGNLAFTLMIEEVVEGSEVRVPGEQPMLLTAAGVEIGRPHGQGH